LVAVNGNDKLILGESSFGEERREVGEPAAVAVSSSENVVEKAMARHGERCLGIRAQ
jgi:hypothetical protein